MSITVSQIHNVLRTYDHLVKSNVERSGKKYKNPEHPRQETAPSLDRVTISEEPREHLSQDIASPPENKEQSAH